MTKAKKPANYVVQADLKLATRLFIRVLCRDCGTVLAPEEQVVDVDLGRNDGSILNVTVPPFCPKCFKKHQRALAAEAWKQG